MTSETNSTSSYSSYNNTNNISGNPFSTSDYRDRSYGNSLSNYEVGSQNLSVLPKITQDDDCFVLSESKFTLLIKHEKGEKEAKVFYKEIIYKNKKGEICKTNINEVKSYKPDNNKIKKNYKKFLNFFEWAEGEIKTDYKKEKEIEIVMEIKKISSNNEGHYFKCDCKFTINDKRKEKGEENEFTESDFLNSNDGSGLGFMINTINEE